MIFQKIVDENEKGLFRSSYCFITLIFKIYDHRDMKSMKSIYLEINFLISKASILLLSFQWFQRLRKRDSLNTKH